MPRKSKKLSETQVPPTVDGSEANPAAPASDKRSAGGHFLPSNSGGPGNPHARHCARMLEMFRNAITDEEMYFLCRVLFQKATAGDMSALKMVWQYKMGKPLQAPNPDAIDRDEWDHYQKDGTTVDEMKQALNRLPSHVGNAIVSAALPSIAESVSRTLSEQLFQSLPPDYWAQRHPEVNEVEQPQAEVPTTTQPFSQPTDDPFYLPDFRTYPESPAPRATQPSAGSNGNSKGTRTATAAANSKKNDTGSNGNSKRSSTGAARASTKKNGTGSNGTFKQTGTRAAATASNKNGTGSNGTSKQTGTRAAATASNKNGTGSNGTSERASPALPSPAASRPSTGSNGNSKRKKGRNAYRKQ